MFGLSSEPSKRTTLTLETKPLTLQVDGHEVLVDCGSGKVMSTDAELGARIEKSVGRMLHILRPVDTAKDL